MKIAAKGGRVVLSLTPREAAMVAEIAFDFLEMTNTGSRFGKGPRILAEKLKNGLWDDPLAEWEREMEEERA